MINDFDWDYIKKRKAKCIIYIILTIICAVCPIFLSLIISNSINNIQTVDLRYNLYLGMMILVIYILSFYMQKVYSDNLVCEYQDCLLMEIYDNINQRKIYMFENKMNDTVFSQKMITEAQNVSTYYVISQINFFKSLLVIVVTLTVLFCLHKAMTCILIVCVSIYWVLVIYTNQRIYILQKDVINLQSQFFGKSQETISNIEQINFYHLFDRIIKSLFDLEMRYIKALLRKVDIQILQNATLKLLRHVFLAIYVIITLNGRQEYGNVILIISVMEPFFSACQSIIQFTQNRQGIKVSKENLGIDKLKPKHIKNEHTVSIQSIDKIGLEGLLGAKQKCQPINYTFEKNQIYCIVGQNGIGKTTLFNMLLGIENDYVGTITFNGILTDKINLDAMYGKQLIYMDQTVELLEFIDVQKESISLSRGEKQQLLLKQMNNHIKNAVIMLDEPTASLDEKQKSILISTLNELGKNNIVLVITHDEFVLKHGFKKLELIEL